MTIATRSVWSAAALAALLVFISAPGAYGCGPDAGAGRDRRNAGAARRAGAEWLQHRARRFCAEVTPGEGRLLACLYAHGDKLTKQCDYALYNAAARLERAIGAITYVSSECRAELETHCADVDVGEGRVAQCLKEHAGELSPGCGQALAEAGVK